MFNPLNRANFLKSKELRQTSSLPGDRFIDIHLFMTSAKVMQYIKKNESPNNSSDNLTQKAEDENLNTLSDNPDNSKKENFSLKLNPGRPNLNAVN